MRIPCYTAHAFDETELTLFCYYKGNEMRHFLQKPKYRLLQALIFWIFFLYDRFTVNRDFWFLSILYMLKRKS